MSSAPRTHSPDPGTTGRRRFLKWISGIGATLSASLAGIPVVRAFLAPLKATPQRENWIKVADDTALLEIGVPVRTDFVQMVDDAWVQSRVVNSVWLYTEDGEHFTAYNGHCTHLGCGVTHDQERGIFFCPCHHGEFAIKTGEVLAGPPPRPLDALTVQVEDGAVFVRYQDFRLGVPGKVAI